MTKKEGLLGILFHTLNIVLDIEVQILTRILFLRVNLVLFSLEELRSWRTRHLVLTHLSEWYRRRATARVHVLRITFHSNLDPFCF